VCDFWRRAHGDDASLARRRRCACYFLLEDSRKNSVEYLIQSS
jgi:hypothetical protein